MFATAASSPVSHAYRQVAAETGVAGASAHDLVAMLFDGLFDALAQARGALNDRRIEAKGRAIGRAVRIVEEGLKAALDRPRGGDLARQLDTLYGYIALRLTQANLHNDVDAIDECARLLAPLRSAWQSIAPVRP